MSLVERKKHNGVKAHRKLPRTERLPVSRWQARNAGLHQVGHYADSSKLNKGVPFMSSKCVLYC